MEIFRWNRPEPVSKWAPRVLNATTRAPACPQPPCGGIPSILCPTTVDTRIRFSLSY